MSLKSRIEEDAKSALKSRDKFALGVLRMVKSEIKNLEIKKRGELDDDSVIGVISSYVKKRREAADIYAKVGRPEVAESETKEIELLQKYLPAQLSDEDLREKIKGVIDELGSPDIKEMGKVMKAAMALIGKSADGKRVNAIVKELLQG